MKTALKWIGWSVLAVVGIVAFMEADKATQWGALAIGLGGWALHDLERRAKQRKQEIEYRLTAIEGKLDLLLNQPVDTHRIADEVERILTRHRAYDPARDGVLSSEWPFGKGS